MWFYYDANGKRLGFSDYNGYAYYYIYNAMGDVIGLYDQYGDVIYYHYDTWGKLVSITNVLGEEITYGMAKWTIAQENPFRYRGYMYDNNTQLYYLNSRYYDPETGRFINADGVENTDDELLGCNMYIYCLNNPVMLIDPSGCAPKTIRRGSRGASVVELQEFLNTQGYSLAVDGIFGPLTEAAVRGFQSTNGLSVDGIVGAQTWGSIMYYKEHSSNQRPSNKNKHQKGQTRRQKDHGGEKGDARRRPNPNRRRPQYIDNGYDIGEKIVFGAVAVGGSIALIYILANDATGVGVLDNAAAAPILQVIWDNGSKVFS